MLIVNLFSHYKRYIILELCSASLEDFIESKYDGPMPSDLDVLIQISSGLQYIHQKKLAHCDMKPANILIASQDDTTIMKLSDFGFCRLANDNESFSLSKVRGTEGWMSAELLENLYSSDGERKLRGTISSDVFATGCVFFNFLQKNHPFGLPIDREKNIMDKNPVNLSSKSSLTHDITCFAVKIACVELKQRDDFPYNIIASMIKPQVERLSIDKVLKMLQNQTITPPSCNPET